jgi:hypothetical protein
LLFKFLVMLKNQCLVSPTQAVIWIVEQYLVLYSGGVYCL